MQVITTNRQRGPVELPLLARWCHCFGGPGRRRRTGCPPGCHSPVLQQDLPRFAVYRAVGCSLLQGWSLATMLGRQCVHTPPVYVESRDQCVPDLFIFINKPCAQRDPRALCSASTFVRGTKELARAGRSAASLPPQFECCRGKASTHGTSANAGTLSVAGHCLPTFGHVSSTERQP